MSRNNNITNKQTANADCINNLTRQQNTLCQRAQYWQEEQYIKRHDGVLRNYALTYARK
jgi:hypothetical protein